ncbi:SWR1-complex protein 5 [Fusarium oxysporum f. sp. albedinis]|nr:SWR1-complex protein 5 [Fusarium oxysporum f. sp. albedinis]
MMMGMMLVDQNSRPARNNGIAAQCDSRLSNRVKRIRSFARNKKSNQIKAISKQQRGSKKRKDINRAVEQCSSKASSGFVKKNEGQLKAKRRVEDELETSGEKAASIELERETSLRATPEWVRGVWSWSEGRGEEGGVQNEGKTKRQEEKISEGKSERASEDIRGFNEMLCGRVSRRWVWVASKAKEEQGKWGGFQLGWDWTSRARANLKKRTTASRGRESSHIPRTVLLGRSQVGWRVEGLLVSNGSSGVNVRA